MKFVKKNPELECCIEKFEDGREHLIRHDPNGAWCFVLHAFRHFQEAIKKLGIGLDLEGVPWLEQCKIMNEVLRSCSDRVGKETLERCPNATAVYVVPDEASPEWILQRCTQGRDTGGQLIYVDVDTRFKTRAEMMTALARIERDNPNDEFRGHNVKYCKCREHAAMRTRLASAIATEAVQHE
jgi:hypothetical protein